jgi:LacI family transcriptional regulator
VRGNSIGTRTEQEARVVRRVTIDDIARASGASRTTVSLVLRDKPGIGLETRQRVRAVAESLGYEQRTSGKSPLPESRVLNVGLVLRARLRDKVGKLPGVNSFYTWVLAGVEAEAKQHRMNLLYATLPVDESNEPLEIPDHLLSQRLDGILLVGSNSETTVNTVASRGHCPIVLLDAPTGAHLFDSVSTDNERGMYNGVQYLISKGHRAIAYLGPDIGSDPNFDKRRNGYVHALAEHDLQPTFGTVTKDLAVEPTEAFLRKHTSHTAIVCSNDVFAANAIQIASQLGIRVPHDLSVLGFDDIDISAQISPSLTTMAVDKITMGRLAVQTLLFRLAWPQAARFSTVTQTELLIRESVGPVRSSKANS